MSHSSTTALCRAMKLQCELYPRCLSRTPHLKPNRHCHQTGMTGINRVLLEDILIQINWSGGELKSGNSLIVPIFWHDPQNQFYTNLIGGLDIKWGNPFLLPELLALLPDGLAPEANSNSDGIQPLISLYSFPTETVIKCVQLSGTNLFPQNSRHVALCLDPYCGLGFALWCLSSVYSGHHTILIPPSGSCKGSNPIDLPFPFPNCCD